MVLQNSLFEGGLKLVAVDIQRSKMVVFTYLSDYGNCSNNGRFWSRPILSYCEHSIMQRMKRPRSSGRHFGMADSGYLG